MNPAGLQRHLVGTCVGALVASLGASAIAFEIRDANDAAELCAHSRSATEEFALAGEGSGDSAHASNGVEGLDEEPGADGVVTVADPVIEGFTARDYARQRGHLLLQPHEVVVESAAFPIVAYAEEVGSIVVPLTDEIELFGGVYALVVEDADSLEFPMAAEEADVVLALHAMGSLAVRLAFVVSGSALEAFCWESESGVTGIDATLISADLVEPLTRTRRARAVTAAYSDLPAGADPGAEIYGRRPVTEVTALDVEGPVGCSATEATVLQMRIETVLADCYVAGLRDNGRLGGALVLGFGLGSDGRVASPEVLIDVLEDETTTDCVLETMAALAILRESPADDVSVRATVVFRRE